MGGQVNSGGASGQVTGLLATLAAAQQAIGRGDLAEAFDQMSDVPDAVRSVRAALAAAMLDSGQARSLADLARVLGLSKSRAAQLVSRGRGSG